MSHFSSTLMSTPSTEACTKLPRKYKQVKLNGGRHVQGILRGFDPFMNLVVDDTIEMAPGGQMNTIGMVVIRGNSIIMLEALERV
ncbi:small nuclear ribonucleoprotein G isoform X1 [Xyrauchen texanus]|uniref:small nuclear ribonucleoprotein G isoform X1 n=1 Tax=Xyrauchen texanus TaxID=154827 RepID=UPI00224210D0|nr:small nuclear ribonucleoprotein G isoform X1 [Xyrauchen texanus]XP_051947865.1 small nuclear ribonucleoprotein G isoform X1 [Xyrauchen texanus]